jgi:hypothetical protein
VEFVTGVLSRISGTGRSLKAVYGLAIADISIKPNSAIAHGRYLGNEIAGLWKPRGSVQPGRPVVLLGFADWRI